MLAVGKSSGPGSTAQALFASPFVVMQNPLGVQSRSTPESEAIDKDASMQRLLAEAWAEFEFEEDIPLSGCVERCPKIEEAAKEETVKEKAAKEEAAKEEAVKEKATKEEAAKEKAANEKAAKA